MSYSEIKLITQFNDLGKIVEFKLNLSFHQNY